MAKAKNKSKSTKDSDIATLGSDIQTLGVYSPKTWINGEVIYDTDLNHIEQGLADARDQADAAVEEADEALTKAQAVENTALTGVNVNGTAAQVTDHVAEISKLVACIYDGDAAWEEKDVTVDGFTRESGAILAVLFVNGNTAEDTQISVNNSNPYPVTGDARCDAGGLVFFAYDNARFYVDAALTKANETFGGMYYATSSTASSTATKVVSCEEFNTLEEGVTIFVSFNNQSTANAPSLNVNSTGAKSIRVNGEVASSSNCFRWAADTAILFVYDGEYWVPVGFEEVYYGESSTTAGTTSKTTTVSPYVLKKGTQISIFFNRANTATSATLNVGSTGAFPINGDTTWETDEVVTFVFDGEEYIVQEGGGESAIEHIAVNSVEQPIIDKTVDLDIDKASYEEDTETVTLGDTVAGGTANVYVYQEHLNKSFGGSTAQLFPFEITVPYGTPTAVIGFYIAAESPLPACLAYPPEISGNIVSLTLAVSSSTQTTVDYVYISILC